MQKSPSPAYRQIASELKRRIRQGIHKPGDRLPAERVLANEFNVSYMTMRNAMSLLVDERVIFRKQGCGCYIESQVIQDKRLAVALVTHEGLSLFAEYYSEILKGIETVCEQTDCGIQIHCTKQATLSDGKNPILESLLRDKKLDGLLLLDPIPENDLRLITEDLDIPVASIDPYKRGRCICVPVDFETATRELVSNLHGLGHRKIGLLLRSLDQGDCPYFRASNAVAAGYRAMMREQGLPIQDSWIKEAPIDTRAAREIAHEWLAAHPELTAVIASSQTHLLAVRDAATGLDLEAPRRLSLAGFAEEDFDPFFTAMVVPTRKRGEAAARRLIEVIRGQAVTLGEMRLLCCFRPGLSVAPCPEPAV